MRMIKKLKKVREFFGKREVLKLVRKKDIDKDTLKDLLNSKKALSVSIDVRTDPPTIKSLTDKAKSILVGDDLIGKYDHKEIYKAQITKLIKEGEEYSRKYAEQKWKEKEWKRNAIRERDKSIFGNKTLRRIMEEKDREYEEKMKRAAEK